MIDSGSHYVNFVFFFFLQMLTSVRCRSCAETLSAARTHLATTPVAVSKVFTDVSVSTMSTTVTAIIVLTELLASISLANIIALADPVSTVNFFLFLYIQLNIVLFCFRVV